MDVFGHETTAHTRGDIASSEFARFSVQGGGESALVQSVSIQYAQQIETITQIGDPNVYWVPGRPSGTLSVSRLVGKSGFFAGWTGTSCGLIDSMAVDVAGGRCGFEGQGSLSFQNGVIESFSVDINSSQFSIRESMTVRLSQMSAN